MASLKPQTWHKPLPVADDLRAHFEDNFSTSFIVDEGYTGSLFPTHPTRDLSPVGVWDKARFARFFVDYNTDVPLRVYAKMTPKKLALLSELDVTVGEIVFVAVRHPELLLAASFGQPKGWTQYLLKYFTAMVLTVRSLVPRESAIGWAILLRSMGYFEADARDIIDRIKNAGYSFDDIAGVSTLSTQDAGLRNIELVLHALDNDIDISLIHAVRGANPS